MKFRIGFRRFRWVLWPALVSLSVILLWAAWHFRGYLPSGALPRDLFPLAISSDGTVVVACTEKQVLTLSGQPNLVGPIRFINLSTGQDDSPPWSFVPAPGEMYGRYEPDLASDGQHFGGYPAKTILCAQLSDDGKLLLVVQAGYPLGYGGIHFQVTVVDLSTRSAVIDQRFEYGGDLRRPTQLSPDGRRVAWPTGETRGDRVPQVVVWDVAGRNELFRLPGSIEFSFSPNSKLIASANGVFDSDTGALVNRVNRGPTLFSPDGRLVAAGRDFIEVCDLETDKVIFGNEGWSPQFLANDHLVAVRDSSVPIKGSFYKRMVPEIVVWEINSGREVQVVPCDQGSDPLREIFGGPLNPQPIPLANGSQFGWFYQTSLRGSPRSSIVAESGWGRLLRLNVPRGIGLDVVDYASGDVRTLHLDGSFRYVPFPEAGKVFILRYAQGGLVYEVWDLPPRRSYAPFAVVAGVLIVFWALMMLRLVIRRHGTGTAARIS